MHMTEALMALATVVLGSVALSLWRVERGPTRADLMLAAQLLGSGSVAVLLLLSQALAAPHLVDIALVLALLASVVGAVFVRRVTTTKKSRDGAQ